MLDEKTCDFIEHLGKCAKGSIRYYNLVAMFYKDVLYVEKLDRPGAIKIVCKPDYDSKIVGEFTKELQVGLGYEITTAKKEDIMTEKFRYVDTLIKPHNKPIVNDEEIYTKGKFKLREYEDVNYCESEFYFDDEGLSNREVIDLLSNFYEENKQYKILTDELKKENALLKEALNEKN